MNIIDKPTHRKSNHCAQDQGRQSAVIASYKAD